MIHLVNRGRVSRILTVAGAVVGAWVSLALFAGAAWASPGWVAYVTDSLAARVTPISTATSTPGPGIPVGSGPSGVAIAPNGKTAYVADQRGLTPIDTATNTPGSPIAIGPGAPTGVAITPSGTTAYVTTYSFTGGTVTPINLATNTPGSPITVGPGLMGVAITPDGTTVYVTNYFDSTVTPISTATNTLGAPIAVGTNPAEIAITPDGTTAYVTNSASATVTPINLATNTPGTPITVGQKPIGIAITPDGQTAYVSNGGDSTVTPIDLVTNTPGAPITVGKNPDGVAITPDGSTVYVTNLGSGSLTPINRATNTAGTPIRAGPAPAQVAITPDHAGLPPSLTRVSQSRATWRESNNRLSTKAGRKTRPPVGTTFSFALSQPAQVTFAFMQKIGGRRVNGRCVTAIKPNRGKPSCTRMVTRGTLAFTGHTGHTGRNQVAFHGRISAARILEPGRYSVAITATNSAAQHSQTQMLSFTIVS